MIAIEVDKFLPRIEQAGGGYRSFVENKVNVYDFIRRHDLSAVD
jgi:hypothetical protein